MWTFAFECGIFWVKELFSVMFDWEEETMKKVLALCLIWVLALSLSGCGIFDMLNDDKDVVDLGSGDTYVRWNLVWNNNEYRPVQSAYFEFN